MVRDTCKYVVDMSKDVHIDDACILDVCKDIESKPTYLDYFECHPIDSNTDIETITAYVFVMDALNFCFWPSDWEYDNLSNAVNDAFTKDSTFKTCERMMNISLDEFKQLVFKGEDFPLLSERHRAINEIGRVINDRYGGKFINMIEKSKYDAYVLLDNIVRDFIMFQDHAIYNGYQIYFYKRAQILVGDLYGAYRSMKNARQIENIDSITCFADYRIPQIMRHRGILKYSDRLCKLIDSKEVIIYGSPEEVEIRACMVIAVERIRDVLREKGINWTAVEVDWLLWQMGEKEKDTIPIHHRTLSIFY